MRQLESLIRDAARVKMLMSWGVPSILLQLRFDAGWPDVLFLIHGGKPLFMEFKRPGEELEPLQAERQDTLRKLGYDAVGPVTTVEDAERLVDEAIARAVKDGRT